MAKASAPAAARLSARRALATSTRPLARHSVSSAARGNATRAANPVRAMVDADKAKTSTGQRVMIIGGDG
jgi:hypothetical protein